MKKFFKFVGGLIKGAGAEFRESPIKFGAGILMLVLAGYVFIGDISFKAKHGDTTVEITTQDN